jgi:hypothetical protein
MTRSNGPAISKKSLEGMRCLQEEESAMQRADTLPTMCTLRLEMHLLSVWQAEIPGEKRTYHIGIQEPNQRHGYFTADTACPYRASRLSGIVQSYFADS